MPIKTLTKGQITAARLREQAKELLLMADELEADDGATQYQARTHVNFPTLKEFTGGNNGNKKSRRTRKVY